MYKNKINLVGGHDVLEFFVVEFSIDTSMTGVNKFYAILVSLSLPLSLPFSPLSASPSLSICLFPPPPLSASLPFPLYLPLYPSLSICLSPPPTLSASVCPSLTTPLIILSLSPSQCPYKYHYLRRPTLDFCNNIVKQV